MRWFLFACIDNFFNFQGRASRREFWLLWLFGSLFLALLHVFAPLEARVFGLLFGVPMTAAMVRRGHDAGASGRRVVFFQALAAAGWLLVASQAGRNWEGGWAIRDLGLFRFGILLSALGCLLLLALMLWPGDKGKNRYGGCAPDAGVFTPTPGFAATLRRHYADFRGTMPAEAFWRFMAQWFWGAALLCAMRQLALWLVGNYLTTGQTGDPAGMFGLKAIAAASALYLLLTALPVAAACVRRLNAQGKSRLWLALPLVLGGGVPAIWNALLRLLLLAKVPLPKLLVNALWVSRRFFLTLPMLAFSTTLSCAALFGFFALLGRPRPGEAEAAAKTAALRRHRRRLGLAWRGYLRAFRVYGSAGWRGKASSTAFWGFVGFDWLLRLAMLMPLWLAQSIIQDQHRFVASWAAGRTALDALSYRCLGCMGISRTAAWLLLAPAALQALASLLPFLGISCRRLRARCAKTRSGALHA